MTIPRPPVAAALSANEAFKLRYPRYLRRSVLVALALTALLVWLFPRYEPVPYRLRSEVIEIVDVEVMRDIEVPVLVPPRPVIPRTPEAAPDDDPDAVETIPDMMDLDTALGVGPIPLASDRDFVASSTLPVLEFRARADYPEIARRAGLEGTVLVHVLVGPDGRVKQVEIAQGVHRVLDQAAVAAAWKCRFTPARQRELAVKAWLAIPYRFRLR